MHRNLKSSSVSSYTISKHDKYDQHKHMLSFELRFVYSKLLLLREIAMRNLVCALSVERCIQSRTPTTGGIDNLGGELINWEGN